QLGGAQQGAVAAQDDDQLGTRGRLGAGRHLLGAWVAELTLKGADRDPGGGQPLGHQPGAAHRVGSPGVRRYQHRALGHLAPLSSGGPPPPTPRAPPTIARRSCSGSSGGAPRRSHRKYSTFPAGPGSGLAVTPSTPRPSWPAAPATVRPAPARA